MSWTEVREWGAIILPLIPMVWLAFDRLMRKSFATTELLLAVHKVLEDRCDEQDRMIVTLQHENALLRKDVEGLPNYQRINKLSESINNLDKHLTESDGRIEGLVGKVDDMREQLRTLDDIVRQIK